MSRLRLPSPALVVALIALFVALGGGAYAALRITSKQVADNSLRSRDVRNNELRGKDVRSRSLSGRDLAFDSLEGPQVDEPSLSRVPSAANAQSLEGRRRVNVAPFTLSSGQGREVLREGPFLLTARCRMGAPTAAGPRDIAEVLISTSVDNAAFDAAGSGELDVATPSGGRVFANVVAPPGTVAVDSLQDGLALAPDGSEEIVDSALYAAVNALGQPGACRFGGYVDLG
ncbi:MAG TPA: hypothetical protein VHJ37_03565 [Thermoleophilaceae bacterium]|nr:hypothetical protein [Thermoleophilaceae bacterium]